MENKKYISEKRFTAVNPIYAAICMALYECDDNNTHDYEADIITIQKSRSAWGSKVLTLRHSPKR